MHVFRKRAKVNGAKVDFANSFCQSINLPFILMAFVDVRSKRIVESWVGRSHGAGEEDLSDLIKAVKLRLALHFTVNCRTEGNQQDTVADIMDGDHIWISAGCYQICVGELAGRLAPVIAFKQCPGQGPDMPQRMVKMGMAYVQLQLNQLIMSQTAWQEKILQSATQALSLSIAVVSETGEIVHDGRHKKDGGGCVLGLRIENNRFVAEPSDLTALHLAISAATSAEKRTSTVSIAGGREGSQLLLVTPLINSSSPLALILFETEQVDHEKLCKSFFDTFELTASERKVALGIIGGWTVAQTAEETGLSVATVRSYMKQIFVKTDTHRQSQLISLYYQSIFPRATGIGPLAYTQH